MGRIVNNRQSALLSPVPRTRRSLREQVAETLRTAIVHGELASGERLVEENLAAQMQVSRGPIREALRQLEQEGLVASFPYRGTVVAELSSAEIVDVIVPIRWTLEQFTLTHALPLMTADDFAELERIVDEMDTAARGDDLAGVVDFDMAFHRLVVERSGQLHSLNLWDMIAPRIRGLFHRMGPHHASLTAIADQHRHLAAALASGDPSRAQRALRDHIAEPELYARLPDKPGAA